MSSYTANVVEAYRKVARIPSLTGAVLLPDDESQYLLESKWQQRDLEREQHVKFAKWACIRAEGSTITAGTKIPPFETHNELLTRYTSCGNLKAVIREVTDKEEKKVQYLEVWDKSKKIINVNLKDLDKHGDVHDNTQFGCLEWSEDKKKILYIAEARVPKSESFFKTGDKKEDCKPGDKHVLKDSWGELLSDCSHPTVCTFDLESKEVVVFSDVIPPGISAGQAIWCHDNESLVFLGWVQEPFRLGLRYCNIRRNAIYVLNSKQKVCKVITHGNHSLLCPRLHPKENRVYFMENPVGGPHLNCVKLSYVDLPDIDSGEVPGCQLVVDAVKWPENDGFPGLFVTEIPRNCWSNDGSHMFFTSSWRSHKCVLDVDVTNGNVKRLTQEGESTTYDVRDDIIVICHSTPSSPPKIKVGKFSEGKEIEWATIDISEEDLTDIKWSVHRYRPEFENLEYPSADCDYLLFQPAGGAKENGCLIVNPHGGPHSQSFTGFVPSIAALCQLGYTVVQVNYRGSIGYGKDGVYSLLGRISTQDVKDVQQVAEKVKGDLGQDEVFLTGGSHGGFLTLHLIGQYPEFYSASCVRNPVTNVATLAAVTDIPDWAYCEAGVEEYSHDSLLSPELLASMLQKSPMLHIHKAKAPCMVMVGDEDLRAPSSQGKQWARKYKALGKTCKVFEYKGNNHSLGKVDAEADGFVNMVLWFNEHKQGSK